MVSYIRGDRTVRASPLITVIKNYLNPRKPPDPWKFRGHHLRLHAVVALHDLCSCHSLKGSIALTTEPSAR